MLLPVNHVVENRLAHPPRAKKAFLIAYARQIEDRHLRETLPDHIRLRDPFAYLQYISYSFMGWAVYQTRFDGLKNRDTWAKLTDYLDLKFIRSLFDSLMQ
jgi:hypothetical protein